MRTERLMHRKAVCKRVLASDPNAHNAHEFREELARIEAELSGEIPAPTGNVIDVPLGVMKVEARL